MPFLRRIGLVLVVSLVSAAATAGEIRMIVGPANVLRPADAAETFFPMFEGPTGKWIANIRWQGRDIVSAPSSYGAVHETGFEVPSPATNWQFGPPDHPGRRSTYQVFGRGVGLLSLTDDSPELAPTAPPAASKHAAYSYTFADPHPVFRDSPMWALMFQARIRVPRFVKWDRVSGTPGEVEIPLGTLYFVMQFRDVVHDVPLPWSVLIFDSRGDLNAERVFVDPSNNLTTITSRLSSDRADKRFSSLALGSAVLGGETFMDERVFRFFVTPANFDAALKAGIAAGAVISSRPADYVLESFGIVQEQALQEGDDSEMASTISHFGFYEADPAYYSGDIAPGHPSLPLAPRLPSAAPSNAAPVAPPTPPPADVP